LHPHRCRRPPPSPRIQLSLTYRRRYTIGVVGLYTPRESRRDLSSSYPRWRRHRPLNSTWIQTWPFVTDILVGIVGLRNRLLQIYQNHGLRAPILWATRAWHDDRLSLHLQQAKQDLEDCVLWGLIRSRTIWWQQWCEIKDAIGVRKKWKRWIDGT
jgi:hypothetical protein